MSSRYIWSLLLFTPVCVLGQANAPHSINEAPMLRSAKVPTYPPIAAAARITGKVNVRVHVVAGKVVQTEILNEDLREGGRKLPSRTSPFLTTPMIENLKTWQFDKSVDDDFVVHYTYNISGTATDNPTNPRVEISPSLNVTITARPVKPTVNY